MSKPKLQQLDMFGGPPGPPHRGPRPGPRKVYPRPDRSPRRRAESGESSCQDCKFFEVITFNCGAAHYKCRWTITRGWATNIGKRDAACKRFEEGAR